MLRRLALIVVAAALFVGSSLAEGPLCVCAPGVTALTDAAGVEVIENGAFESIFTVREGALYAAGRRGDYRLFDAEGHAVGDEPFAMIHDAGGALVFRQGGLCGAMDDAGAIVIDPEWTQLTGDGADGWLALNGDPLDERPDEIFHLDAAGEARGTGVYTACGLQPVECDRMPFQAGNGLYGAVNGKGEVAVKPAWKCLGAFENGYAKAWREYGVGLIDADGNAIVPPVYDWLERGGAMIAAQAGDRVDVFSTDGARRLFTLRGEGAEVRLVGSCLSLTANGKSLLYGPDGTLRFEGDSAVRFREGLQGRLIASDGAWGEACEWLTDPDGSPASGRFQQLLPLCADRYAYLEMDGVEYYSDELGALQRSWDYGHMRYGLTDGAGNRLLPAAYSEIRALGDDRLLLVTETSVQIADVNGRVLREWAIAESEAPSA
ncbi:MAG: WG repeat-containing protein [Clostridia bacterium]|nr:WG repeat-containing protein [Clostridia bacterium]